MRVFFLFVCFLNPHDSQPGQVDLFQTWFQGITFLQDSWYILVFISVSFFFFLKSINVQIT